MNTLHSSVRRVLMVSSLAISGSAALADVVPVSLFAEAEATGYREGSTAWTRYRETSDTFVGSLDVAPWGGFPHSKLAWEVTADGGIVIDTSSQSFGGFEDPFTKLTYRFTVTEPTMAFLSAVGENQFGAYLFIEPVSVEHVIDELEASLYYDGKGPAGQGGTMFPNQWYATSALLQPGTYRLNVSAIPDPSTGISDEDMWAHYRLTLPTPGTVAVAGIWSGLCLTRRRKN